jgi:hypothetical protein
MDSKGLRIGTAKSDCAAIAISLVVLLQRLCRSRAELYIDPFGQSLHNDLVDILSTCQSLRMFLLTPRLVVACRS